MPTRMKLEVGRGDANSKYSFREADPCLPRIIWSIKYRSRYTVLTLPHYNPPQIYPEKHNMVS